MTPKERIRAWRENPLLFVQDCIQVKPSKQQEELLVNFAKSKRTTIRSGHGTGKDASASWLIIWFLVTRYCAKVICTAPTARQLNDILWSEISKWLRQSIVADEFEIRKDKIYHKSNPKEWWCRAVSVSVKASKDEQAETLAGFHGDHMLIVCDEASGIPDPVYVPLEGAMTQEDNKCLLIGNMTKRTGYFYETHFHPELNKKWYRLHWDSRESENVSDDMIQYFADKYGVESSIYAVRVKGEPPLADDDSLIPLEWSLQCVDNNDAWDGGDEEPLYFGVDVARYGDDSSIILPRKGFVIHPWYEFRGMNTIALGGEILMRASDMAAEGVAIDEIGVGAGVCDWLTMHNTIPTFGINVANASSDITKFTRLRDELWCAVRDNCMKGRYCFPGGDLGNELCNELACVGYDFNPHGGITVDSKKMLKSRGVASPNIADALCLTEYFYNVATKVFISPEKKKKKRRFSASVVNSTYDWMAV